MTMSCLRLIFIHILLLCPLVFAVIDLEVSGAATIGTPVNVKWTRDPDDPSDFQIRFAHEGEDYGLAAQVTALDGATSGVVSVTFQDEGHISLRAFDWDLEPLGESIPVHIADWPSSPSQSAPSPDTPIPTSTQGSSTSVAPSSQITLAPSSTSFGVSSTHSSTMTFQTAMVTATSFTGPPKPSETLSQAPISASHHHPLGKLNSAAIAGGVVGGVVFLALIFSGIVLCIRRRRRRKAERRLTFHRDLMVQHRPGLTSAQPSPILPRFSFQRRYAPSAPSAAPLAHSYQPAHAGPTDRQLQLNARVRQLEDMMHEIRFRPGMSRVLEQLRMQVSWLRAQRNSPWALHQTDERPLHYDLYMTS